MLRSRVDFIFPEPSTSLKAIYAFRLHVWKRYGKGCAFSSFVKAAAVCTFKCCLSVCPRPPDTDFASLSGSTSSRPAQPRRVLLSVLWCYIVFDCCRRRHTHAIVHSARVILIDLFFKISLRWRRCGGSDSVEIRIH